MERQHGLRLELDPTDRQRTAFRRASDLARHAYNWGLANREAYFELVIEPARAEGRTVPSLTDKDQMTWWRRMQDDEFPWAREFSSRIPRHALIDLDRAYKNWWEGRGRRPRFKSRDRTPAAFRVSEHIRLLPPRMIPPKHGGERRVAAAIMLPCMDTIRVKGHPVGLVHGEIKQATVSERAGRWFVALLIAEEVTEPTVRIPASESEVVGIDVGLRNSLTLSTGEVIQGPRALSRHLRRLARYQRMMSRRQKASGRRKRAVARVARQHSRVGNIRREWQHRVSDRLTQEFAVIGREGLNTKGLMSHRGRNGRAWSDLGIGELFRQIDYKASWRGATVVVADRWHPSSKTCSKCGVRNGDLRRSDTVFLCPACGFRLDRDLNAALNLRPVAAIPAETQNARGGNVRPRPASPVLWRIPTKRAPDSGLAA